MGKAGFHLRHCRSWGGLAWIGIPLAVASFGYFGLPFAREFGADFDWLTTIDEWLLNNAAYPGLFALAIGLTAGTLIVPQIRKLFLRRLVRRKAPPKPPVNHEEDGPRLRDSEPLARALSEAKFEAAASAPGGSNEGSLDLVIWWIANESAWGRWQAAKHYTSKNIPVNQGFHLQQTATEFTRRALEGRIQVRACRGNQTTYEEIPPEFWKGSYLTVESDDVRLWKISIAPRSGQSATITADYANAHAEWSGVREIWP